MIHLRKITLVGLVWLTAASTLFAGMPHFECVCPNGQRLSYCLSLIVGGGGCCCNGTCCASGRGAESPEPAKAQTPKAEPCCGGQEAEPGGCCCCHDKPARKAEGSRAVKGPRAAAKPDRLRVQRLPCAKNPARSDAQMASSSEPLATHLAALDLIAPVPAALDLLIPALLAHGDSLWGPCAIPPPTDRVLVLQHFLI